MAESRDTDAPRIAEDVMEQGEDHPYNALRNMIREEKKTLMACDVYDHMNDWTNHVRRCQNGEMDACDWLSDNGQETLDEIARILKLDDIDDTKVPEMSQQLRREIRDLLISSIEDDWKEISFGPGKDTHKSAAA